MAFTNTKDEMDPSLVNDLQIVGKVIGVLRFLS